MTASVSFTQFCVFLGFFKYSHLKSFSVAFDSLIGIYELPSTITSTSKIDYVRDEIDFMFFVIKILHMNE